MRRLTDEELFRIGPAGLEEISDDTLMLRIIELEHAAKLQPTNADSAEERAA